MQEPKDQARECRTCHATHRDPVQCPPVNRWLISGQRLTFRENLAPTSDPGVTLPDQAAGVAPA